MMKKQLRSLWLALLCSALVLLGALPVSAASKNLTFSIFFPPTHDQAIAAVDFAKEIEKRPTGR